jgi:sugar O-acyltransferase (sialic acid O-acetyltransferase NeuD family)
MARGGVVLVAAGGLARETLEALSFERPVVVLDDNPDLWGTSLGRAPIVGGLEDVKRYDDHAVVVCAGRGSVRRRLVERLSDLGVGAERFTSVVHASVSVPASCTVGAGTILLPGVALTADVRLGSHVVAMPHVTFTHDDVVEDYVTLAAGVSLGGSVHVGSGAYLGMHACVREGLTVGPDSILGMGAALVHSLPPGQTWAGVPARPLEGNSSGES